MGLYTYKPAAFCPHPQKKAYFTPSSKIKTTTSLNRASKVEEGVAKLENSLDTP
jgi:hypothetical protein